MIDIMAQCPDDTSYKTELEQLAGEGFVFLDAFTPVIYEGHEGETFWLRLCVTTPPVSDEKILKAPFVEYRYSANLNGWTSNGVTVSQLAKGIHDLLASQGRPL